LIILLTGTGISAQKPNIILIISDDQSLNSIGYAGGAEGHAGMTIVCPCFAVPISISTYSRGK